MNTSIVVRNSDSHVMYAQNGLELTASGVTGNGFVDSNLTTANATLLQNVAVPIDFLPGAFTYINGVFAIANSAAYSQYCLTPAQNSKIASLTASCAAAITAGFTSSALGSMYTYPSQLTDQQNLAANVLSSLLPALPSTWTTPQMCMNAAGVWEYVNHTAAQIQQAGSDGKTAILAALTQKQTLVNQVMTATTVTEVNAINW